MPPEANDATAAASPTELSSGLHDYMNSAAFRDAMADEFPEDAAEWTDPVSRRNFLTVMGAGLALAGATGCTPRPASMRKIVPYTRQPEQMIPGVPLFFASAAPMAGYATGVVVRSHEGRPVKIEGNPDHPSSGGGTSAIDQASVLDLYDPDRSQTPTRLGAGVGLDEAVRAARSTLFNPDGSPKQGVRLRVLTGAVTSPTLAGRVEALLTQFPQAKWVQYEACGQDNVRDGLRRAFGGNYAVNYDFHAADVVLSLDADFLGEGPGHARYCKDFATRRRVRNNVLLSEKDEYVTADGMSRLYVAECMPSQTGSVADHRLPLLAGQVEAFARAVAAGLGVPGASAAGGLPDAAQKWVAPLVKDLQRAGTKALVIAGDSQPAAVHALAHAMNSQLKSIGTTVRVTAPVEARPDGRVSDLATLVREMAAEQVDALFVLGGTNPAFTAPADLDFVGAVKKVKFKLHLGQYQDETAGLCEWHINEAHYLECWGDGRGHDGTVALQQPLIAPLYNGRSAAEVLNLVTAAPQTDGYDIVREHWRTRLGAGPFEPAWQEAVRLGVVKGSAAAAATVTLAPNWAAGAGGAYTVPADKYEINFRPDPTLFDGRFANNGWLQELPKPVTRISWDNAAFVSPATAKKLDVEKEFRWTAGERGRTEVSILTLTVKVGDQDRTMKLPVWILPGHPDQAVTVHLGHGRERGGRVGNAADELNAEGKLTRGSNAYPLRTAAAPTFAAAAVAKTGDTYHLACIQAYWSMGQVDPLNGQFIDRSPVRRGSNEDYKANPWFAKILPTAAGETALVTQNIPGQQTTTGGNPDSGVVRRQGNVYGPVHDHKDGEPEHQHGDRRIHALTMYHPNDRLYPEGSRGPGRRWGMAIDLSACTGCNSCMVACQSENNIPTVGKHEITRGHDMYWIRIDRYYEGPVNAPNADKTFFMPVPCQQCEKAPCEVVCPVAATAHSADGLNDMAYNRCVGTRYCSNNCPYKVRRFNFLTFQDWYTESRKLGRNPDVSVRSRGVMEKCTYCVQRIRYAEIVAEREFRPIKDGEVRTACQSACPSGAIVFGDLGDQASLVGKWKAEPANYGLLAELNTMPRTTYLASVRNPNPELVAALK